MRSHELLDAWATFKPRSSPMVLQGDELLLAPENTERRVLYQDWDAFITNPEFGARDKRLHLGLLPMPFVGNLKTARIVLLMLNPGFSMSDYFGEFRVPAYRQALVNNLHGNNSATNIFIEPRFSWHSGFRYWHGKFSRLIDVFAQARQWARTKALALFARQTASLELVPYHSSTFGLPRSIIDKMRSASLVRSYVAETLVPRSQSGDVLLVVTRAARYWNLKPSHNIVVYSNAEARSAHLGPNSRGGRAILTHLASVAELDVD